MNSNLVFGLVAMVLSFSSCQSASVKNSDKVQKVFSPAIISHNKPREIYATNISFDKSTGQIKYTLPEAGLVQIRIGIKEGGPLLRYLLDWEERSAGEHLEVWDGKDSTGQMDFSQRTDLMMVLKIIPVDSQGSRQTFKGFRKSPQFHVTLPDTSEKNDQGLPVVSGLTNVRIRLDENDKTWLTQSKYELVMFIDNVFLMEDEEGMNPFTYKLDTKMFNNGVHALTINLAVYDGEIGTKSILFLVQNP